MKFPYDRIGAPSDAGRTKVRDLADSPVPYLKSEAEDGVWSYKRGKFLSVERESVVGTITAFLWALIARTTGILTYRRIGTSGRKTVETGSVLRAPGGLPGGRDIYAGAGYVLSMSHGTHINYPDPYEASDPNKVWAWPSLIYVGSGAQEVLSLSGDNKPRANVSFYDVAQLEAFDYFWYLPDSTGCNSDSQRPCMYATGWDAAAGGYGFGWFGNLHITDLPPSATYWSDGTPNTYGPSQYFSRAYFYGNTKDRKLTRVDLTATPATTDLQFSGLYRICTVGSGKLAALVTPYTRAPNMVDGLPGFPAPVYEILDSKPVPSPPRMMRSADHGRSFTFADVPELEPYMLRIAVGSVDKYQQAYLDDMSSTFHASPIGGGRVAMVVLTALDQSHVYSSAEMLARPPEYRSVSVSRAYAYYQRYRFFISDPTGTTFTNMPWPADDWPAGSFPVISLLPAGTWTVPQLGNFIDAAFMNPITTAGPGSFFVSVMARQYDGINSGPTAAPARWQMMWTVDYGATWNLSPYHTTDAISVKSNTVTPIVVRPYKSAINKGELHIISVSATGVVRVFKTDATFEKLTKVYEKTVDNYYSIPTQTRINAAYTGSIGSVNDSAYTPRIFPGYPEFEKP